MSKKDFFKAKIEALTRLTMNYGFSGILPLYIVTEYPRSGGSWFSQMLSDCLQVPYPRNEFPKFKSCVMQRHYKYSPFFQNVFCILRDGRDIMVSYYYYSLFENERYNQKLVENTRKKVSFSDYDNIGKNLPKFIEYLFTHKGHPRYTWTEFVDSWIDKKDVAFVKYEDLLKDAIGELYKSILEVTGQKLDKRRLEEIVEKYSFKKIAKRKPGQEDKKSFLRKGVTGDWKNYFTQEAKEIFDHYAGETLIKLGYEEDSSWVNTK